MGRGKTKNIAVEGPAESPQAWEIAVDLPCDRLDWILGNLTLDDAIAALLNLDEDTKAQSLQFLLQRHMNRLTAPPDAESLESLGERLGALAQPATALNPSDPENSYA